MKLCASCVSHYFGVPLHKVAGGTGWIVCPRWLWGR